MPLSLTDRFRRLALVILGSGTLAGIALFGVQRAAVVPLIETAEAYETAHNGRSLMHVDDGWQPANGAQRTSVTLLVTTMTAIAFAALLFGAAGLIEAPLDARTGALWGLAGFACFALAPALVLPPLLPGAEAADLHLRQLWWAGTVAATACGLWLIAGRRDRPWVARTLGLFVIAAPHIVGAPSAAGAGVLPPNLVREFAVRSVASSAVFWLLLGTIGGLLSAETMEERRHGQHLDHARR
jgi:cobalt transporter subunit CbtA